MKFLVQASQQSSSCARSKCAPACSWEAFTLLISNTLLRLCPKRWHLKWHRRPRTGSLSIPGFKFRTVKLTTRWSHRKKIWIKNQTLKRPQKVKKRRRNRLWSRVISLPSPTLRLIRRRQRRLERLRPRNVSKSKTIWLRFRRAE